MKHVPKVLKMDPIGLGRALDPLLTSIGLIEQENSIFEWLQNHKLGRNLVKLKESQKSIVLASN